MLLTGEFLIRHQCQQTPVFPLLMILSLLAQTLWAVIHLHPWTCLNELLLEEHRCHSKTIMEQQKCTCIVVDVAYAAQVKSHDQDD